MFHDPLDCWRACVRCLLEGIDDELAVTTQCDYTVQVAGRGINAHCGMGFDYGNWRFLWLVWFQKWNVAVKTAGLFCGFTFRPFHTIVSDQEIGQQNYETHTAASIRWSSPTQLLISRSEACHGRADGMPSILQSMTVCESNGLIFRYKTALQSPILQCMKWCLASFTGAFKISPLPHLSTFEIICGYIKTPWSLKRRNRSRDRRSHVLRQIFPASV